MHVVNICLVKVYVDNYIADLLCIFISEYIEI